jgi:hypothetical protein
MTRDGANANHGIAIVYYRHLDWSGRLQRYRHPPALKQCKNATGTTEAAQHPDAIAVERVPRIKGYENTLCG